MGEPFRVIAADPPWKFGDGLGTRGAQANYTTMTAAQVCKHKLPPIADDAYLFLWRVSSMVEEAYRVVRAWGFVPKSEIVWCKLTANGKPWFGMGRHVRAAHETAILAVRGRPRPLVHHVRSRFAAPVGVHSQKPEMFYKMIEELAAGPYVELFARSRRPGWSVRGNEIDRGIREDHR